jgi:hypothetical protein
MRRRAGIAIACAALTLAAGCGTSPPSRFYTLSPTAAPVSATSTLVVAVGPVTIPGVVDRPEFVVNTGPNEVRIDDFNRWASPLQDNLTRAIADNLSAMLGTSRVIRFPQPIAVEPDYRVVVEVRTFESVPGESATLDAVWTIRRSKDGKSQTGRTTARESVAEKGYDALAAAHSRAVARASKDIADAILALQRAS